MLTTLGRILLVCSLLAFWLALAMALWQIIVGVVIGRALAESLKRLRPQTLHKTRDDRSNPNKSVRSHGHTIEQGGGNVVVPFRRKTSG